MTPDVAECVKIYQMSKVQLLDYVIKHPEYLTDPCHQKIGDAIRNRHLKLRRKNIEYRTPTAERS